MNSTASFTRLCTVLILSILLVSGAKLNAQYKVNKHLYDHKSYTYQPGDPYNPGVCGVVSFLVPGVGQIIAAETGRGIAFLGGYVACWVVYGVGAASALNDAYAGDDIGAAGGVGVAWAGLVGALVVDIWATVDAVRVAKVNNLAWRDNYKPGAGLQFSPDIKVLPNQKVAPALTMRYRF